MQAIMQAIMEDKSLSTYAHNGKIITKNGMVTLKGPVRSEEEKKTIVAKAAEVAGGDKVTNEMDKNGHLTETVIAQLISRRIHYGGEKYSRVWVLSGSDRGGKCRGRSEGSGFSQHGYFRAVSGERGNQGFRSPKGY